MCTTASVCELLNATTYGNVLKEYVLQFANFYHGTDHKSFHFMHDKACAHTATVTKQWLANLYFDTMDGRAVLLNMDSIENISKIFNQRAYAKGFQFQTTECLRNEFVEAWNEISLIEL